MIKVWVKLPHRGALYILSLMLKESGTSLEVKREFYAINNVQTGETNDGVEPPDVFPLSSFNLPTWWYLGGAFVLEDLQELINRDVIWKAESYDSL